MQNQMLFPVTDNVKQQTARHLYDQNEITVMDESMPSPREIRPEETIVLPEIVSMPEYICRHYAEEIIRTCREEINDAHLCVMYDCECQRKSEPSANQYLSHLCERILEPPTPKVTANT